MKNIMNKLKKEPKSSVKKSVIPFRLNVLFFIVFGLFIALIAQLAYLQIINKDYFVSRIQAGETSIIEGNAPRGMIYDAKGEVLVSNKAKQAVMFTKSSNMSANDILEVSKKINEIITIKPDKLTERDKKDFWLANEDNLEAARKRLAKKQKINGLSNAEEYQLLVDGVTDEEIKLSPQEMIIASIYKRISSAYALQPIFIKNEEVTKEEIALVGENMTEIPGLSANQDWERDYPQGDLLKTILGTVSTDKSGLPESELNEYLAKGYSRNDRVGLSYLEKEYESVLRGTKSRSEISLDGKSKINSQKETYAGEKGENLMLTIDLNYQKKVKEIVEKHYKELINNGTARYSDGAYAVALNPQTGEVLAMVGMQRDSQTGELSDDTLGTINKAFVPGSSIKGATVMSGVENKIISPNETLIDEPLVFVDGTVKASLFNPKNVGGRVAVNTVDALTVSSNVYMMKIALRMMGANYSPGMSLPTRTDVFETLRSTYREYGLGASTGIDIPGESTGLSPTNYFDDNGNLLYGRMGNLLDLSFGNFDTYTPMQLAQYVATIANGGNRIAPRLVKGIYGNDKEGGLGNLEESFTPTVLNEVKSKEAISVIQDGFYGVVNSTNPNKTGTRLMGSKYTLAAKTGTAETPITDPNNPNNVISLNNLTVVAYNADENPEIAVAVMLPHLSKDTTGANSLIAKEMFDAYYDLTH